MILLMVSGVYSAYLRDILITVHQPDGTEINCFASGDEYYNWLHDADGYTIIQSQSDGYYYYAVQDGEELKPSIYKYGEINPNTTAIPKWLIISPGKIKERRAAWFRGFEQRDAPTSGTINNLNIFIRFSDEYEFATPRSFYDQPYNKEDGPSLKHYFLEVSYDTLTVNTHHFPVCELNTNISYQDPHPRSYYMPSSPTNPDGYGGDDERRIREHTLLRDAVEFVNSEIPDTLVVDGDGDGRVDNTSFLISGSPGAWASLLWPHRWYLYTYDVEVNGSFVGDYNFNLAGDPTYFNVGTLCHEFYHSLGAPDLYHYSYDGRVPVGGWDVMEANSDPPQYPCAFMKWKYGDWIPEIPVISTTGIYSLNPLQSPDNNCFRINSPYTDDEYFVVEYRKKEGMYEVGTPGYDSGLLVYRINTVVGNGNADGPPDEVYVYRYSGTPLSNGDISRAPFNQSSGRVEFNDSTNPSCFLTDTGPGGINIRDVGYAGNTIQFMYQTLSLYAEITNITDEGDGDGVLNPGDDAVFQIFVSNPLPEFNVNNVTGVLSTTEENVFINNGEISFEDLTIEDPEDSAAVEVTFLPGVPLGDIPFTLYITAEYEENGSEFDYSVEYHFNVAISLNQTGFPYGTTDQVRSSPAVSDINGDGIQEIIFGEDIGLLHVLGPTGEELPGFPFSLGGENGLDVWGSPAVADLEGDGDVEIIIGSKNKHLFVLNADGSVQVDYDAEQFLMGTPALGDIDGDGELEIVFGGYSTSGKLFAINPDGTDVPGFPIILGEKIQKGVALADFNGNDKVDIVCGTDSGNLWLIYDDGTVADGFPFEAPGDFRSAPSILDMNGEKIIFSGNNDNNFYAINEEGALWFQVETGNDVRTSAGIVDLMDGVGIFFGSDDGFIYGVNLIGDPLPGWPIPLEGSIISSPVFSDLDGDGEVEIITATVTGNLYAFHLDGSLYPHFPISGSLPYGGSPAVKDIDDDNDYEILIGSSVGLEIIDIKEPGSIQGYWNMHRGNLERNGLYHSSQQIHFVIIDHFDDWNLVGLPMHVEDSFHLNVFPDAVEGTLYSFEYNYVNDLDLEVGTGYWLRFNDEGSNTIVGLPVYSLSILLSEDWNLISGITNSVHIGAIDDPNEIIIPGTFYGYNQNYEEVSILLPGSAYWVRTTGPGTITLNGDISVGKDRFVNRMTEANTIKLNDQTLFFGVSIPEEEKLSYSLPPVPPAGAFDVRFMGDWKFCEDYGELNILMSDKPVLHVYFNIKDETKWLLSNEKEDIKFMLSGTGQIDFPGNFSSLILEKMGGILPNTFALNQNYPNPFNSVTQITYSIPQQSYISLEIFDLTGAHVKTLVDEKQNSGLQTVQWDGTDKNGELVGTGVYFYQINSNIFSQTRKMVLIK